MRRRRHGFCNDLFSVVETASHSNSHAASGEPHRAILRAQAAGRGARVGESGAGRNRAESGMLLMLRVLTGWEARRIRLRNSNPDIRK